MFMPQLYSISVAEYIQQHGMPELKDRNWGTYYRGKALDLSHKSLTNLEGLQNIPTDVLAQVQVLDLRYNQLQELPANIFSGLHNLHVLYLSNNQLQMLPNNIFSSLPNLRILDLSANRLRVLQSGIFRGLNYLSLLFLNRNKLQELSADIFNGLTNLSLLFLDYNQLQELPIGIFNGLHNLQSLTLYCNRFSIDFLSILPKVISSAPNLESLDQYSSIIPISAILKDNYRVRNPKTLQDISANEIMKNFAPEQLEMLAETNYVAFDLLPLSEDKRQAILNKVEERKKIQFMAKALVESLGQAILSTSPTTSK